MKLFDNAAEKLDRRVGWDKLPLPLAMLTRLPPSSRQFFNSAVSSNAV